MKLLHFSTRMTLTLTAGAVGVLGMAGLASATSPKAGHDGRVDHHPVRINVKAPRNSDNAGIAGAAWIVDLEMTYRGRDALDRAGFTTPQLTGPAGHNNVAPLPGTFSTGKDDRLPGLVVLTSTTNDTLPGFSGPGTNLANLFNVTGVTDRKTKSAQIGDTWIVGAPIAGRDIDTVLTVAVVADLNHNGVYDDAPAVVADADGDGDVDARDLKTLGVASQVETVRFHINGATA